MIASRKGGGSRIATGFLHRKSNIVSASWHLVAGATDIAVEGAAVPRCSAKVTEINLMADLVMLELDREIEVDPPIGLYAFGYFYDERLWTLGHRDVEEPSLASFCVKAGNSEGRRVIPPRLEEIVDELAREDLKRLGDLGWHAEEGIPFLSMRVLNGVPGLTVEHTGAPIVNDDGDLIGIAGGVIKGRSWAVSADGDWHPVTPEDLQRLAEPELWQLTAFFWN